ncbi:hypothetical protein BBJ28_00003131 [Nothophytophthora sp. Chile5]|nr:hypothetical protein BBJ28_00003131 [Nothophytophthora sp. Chile5]
MHRRLAVSTLRCVSGASRRPLARATAQCAKPMAALSSLRRLGVAVVPSLRRPALVATFSSDAETPSLSQMSEHQFMELADETLHQIQDWLDGIEEMLDESDIVFSVGASLLRGCMLGCWMEDWMEADELCCGFEMSSGPRRYEYDAPTGTWVNTRDGAELMELLRAEILETTGIEIY